ncbi:MAG TPA: hypothetical protein VHC48_11010, partial [Puia sp.]|nr:hypothetical protein [Puia sp.]
MSSDTGRQQSQWVFQGPDGKLNYKHTPKGDRIMDFSYAGYGGGDVPIPDVQTQLTVSPVAGDNTEHLQQAIDEVSRLPLVNGFRGAVL